MDTPKISVIVPVYKVENYLDRCVKSILNQTYDNLEILLVDDGSPDSCPRLCDDYAKSDDRVRVIHKKNGGLSDARNAGLEVATGEYITFVDSDDWISDNCIKVLIEEAQRNDTLISVIDTVESDGSRESERSYSEGFKYKELYTAKEAMQVIFLQHEFNTSAWAKLYHKSIFDGIRFTTGILYEDLDLIYRLFERAGRISFSPAGRYYYFQRQDSIVHARFDSRHFVLVDISGTILRYVDEKHPDIHDAAVCRYVFSNILILSRIIKDDSFKTERAQLCDNLLGIKKEIYHNREINSKQKIKVFLISVLRKLRRI